MSPRKVGSSTIVSNFSIKKVRVHSSKEHVMNMTAWSVADVGAAAPCLLRPRFNPRFQRGDTPYRTLIDAYSRRSCMGSLHTLAGNKLHESTSQADMNNVDHDRP